MRINGSSLPSNLCRVILLGIVLASTGCHATNGWVMNRSGMKAYQRGHFAQARHRFAKAIAHDPCNPDYRHNLAMALQKQGDMVACEKILRHNLTIDAMHQPTYHSLAQAMITQGRGSEAEELLAGWVATQPYVPEANIEMAWLQRETGNYAAAEQSLQNALRADPMHPTALAHLGQLYHTTGRPDQAAAYYQRSLASNWDQPEVQSRLATLSDPSTMSRSAMMANSPAGPMLAGGPMMTGDTTFASYPAVNGDPMMASSSVMMPPPVSTGGMFGSDPQAVALEDVRANQLPRNRRRGRGNDSESRVASYPLPNFDANTTAWAPSGIYAGQSGMAFQSPEIAVDSMAIPQIANNTYPANFPNGNGQLLPPQADPAHFYDSTPEMTASLPVVDPH